MLAHLKQKHRDHHHQLQQQKQKQKQQHQEQKQQLEPREFQSDKTAEPQPAFGVHKMPKALTSKDSSTTTTTNNNNNTNNNNTNNTNTEPNTDGISVHKAEAKSSPPVSSEASGTTDESHQSSSGAATTTATTTTSLRPLLPLPTSSESQEPDNNATAGACAATKMTCDALCSLSYATINHNDDNQTSYTNLPSCDYTYNYNYNSGDSTSNTDSNSNNKNNKNNKKASHRNSVTSSNSPSHKNDKLPNGPYPDSFFQPDTEKSSRRGGKGCPKQHQLPMFLSSE